MMRAFAFLICLLAGTFVATAHGLVVFASVDCNVITVEAKFSNGNVAQKGELRVLDAEREKLATMALEQDGTALISLDSIDHSEGLYIEVDTGGHDNYWIVTPDDIARGCGS